MWKSAKIKHGSKLQSPARQSISRNEGLIDRYWDKYLPPEEDAADESNPFLRARTPDWSVKRQTQRPQSAMMYTNGFQRPFRPLEVPKNVWKTKKEQVTSHSSLNPAYVRPQVSEIGWVEIIATLG